jgi:hypothetical protein
MSAAVQLEILFQFWVVLAEMQVERFLKYVFGIFRIHLWKKVRPSAAVTATAPDAVFKDHEEVSLGIHRLLSQRGDRDFLM